MMAGGSILKETVLTGAPGMHDLSVFDEQSICLEWSEQGDEVRL